MKKTKICGYILLVAALALFAAVVIFSASAVREMRGAYEVLAESEISEEEISLIYYDDKLLVSLAYGSTDTCTTMDDFLQHSVRNIDMRIVSSGVVYAAFIAGLASCFLACKYRENKRKHIVAVVICGLAVYLVFLAAVFGMMLAQKIPVYLPPAKSLLVILTGLAAVVAGGCAFALWLRNAKHKVVISVLMVVFILISYLFGAVCEAGLFCDRTAESVNYFMGIKRAGAIAFEAVNPYCPMTLPLVVHAEEIAVSPIIIFLYTVKSLLWILLPAMGKRKSAADGE